MVASGTNIYGPSLLGQVGKFYRENKRLQIRMEKIIDFGRLKLSE